MDNNYMNQNSENQNTMNQSNTQNMYGQQAYTNPYYQQQNAYQPYQQQNMAAKRPKKKKSGFGATLGKCAAVAVVFGLVAGSVFTGVSYVGSRVTGVTQQSGKTAGNTGNSANVTKTQTGNASDLIDVSGIAKAAMPSIVAITNTGSVDYQTIWGVQEQETQSCGSGIIIKEDNKYLYIVTNNHVVKDAKSLTVQFSDGETVSCEVKGTDQSDDLAVVKVDLKSIKKDTLSKIKVATVGDSEDLEVGQGVIAIGNALGYGQSVTNGIVSALGRTVTVQDTQTGQNIVNSNMIQTNAAINPGNSGGALLNAKGEVIGINSVKYSDTDVEGFGYAIPMSDAMPIVEQLITREKVDQSKGAYLGIQGQDISAEVAQTYNMPEGIYVYKVLEGTAAADAGIRQGDIITEFDGQKVSTMNELKELMSYYKSGKKVKIKIKRLSDGYQDKTLEVKLGSQSATTNK